MIFLLLGKRYERLLFFAAPILLATIFVCFVAAASSLQEERVQARCYLQAANVFGDRLSKFERLWNSEQERDRSFFINYQLEISLAWIAGSRVVGECYGFIEEILDEEMGEKPPSKIISEFKLRAEKLSEKPLSIYGVKLSSVASLDFYLTNIEVDLLVLTRVFQIVLLPLILLWLGSLYSTRCREALIIGKADSLLEVFPHIINMYPAFDLDTPRKKNRLAPYAKPVACFVYALTRIGLLLVFTFPPVLAYLIGLYLGAHESYSVWYFLAGVIVCIFFITTLIAEFLPMHYNKLFPDPKNEIKL